MPSFILALDQGTTSSRAMLVDADGQVAGVAAEEFPQLYPQPGWVEHDPWDIWNSQQSAIRQVMEARGVSAADIAAVGITNQRETTLVWRRADGQPVGNAIVWQDRRTAGECEALRAEGRTEWLQAKTGLLPDPYFSATKLARILQGVPGAGADPGDLAFGTVDTWLIWQLSGRQSHYSDRTNASRTLLWNLREERWDPELLELFQVPESVLPEVLRSAADFGEAATLGAGAIAPRIMGVAGDQQAALFGQAGWEPGIAKNTYGTGCFLLLNTGADAPTAADGLLTTA
ncbi:MAG TPA: FGGY family carbohydrate kinase, partial [Armatimonadota bacterium]|nr:FGGY family carbohydrate kinase [Armatimonadota bacterium]